MKYKKIDLSPDLISDLERYISDNLIPEITNTAVYAESLDNYSEKIPERKKPEYLGRAVERPVSFLTAVKRSAPKESAASNLPDDISSALSNLDESFSEMLLRKIDEKGLKDSECYKKALVDRKLFSKIRSDRLYRPSKQTALAFAFSLELSLPEAEDLLKKAGFALSRSNKTDVIAEYFLIHGRYDLHELNEVLYKYDLPMIGC